MKGYLLIIAVFCLSLTVLAFPKASKDDVTEFRRLFRESLEENCNKKSSMLGRSDFFLPDSVYKKFCGFGLEICELIYLESVNGDVVRAVQADNKYSPHVIGIESLRILEHLWCLHTMQFSSRYTDVDFMWTGEPIRLQWEGGAQLANERASFLVKEMRIAKLENRLVDVRRAAGNLQIMGVFAFPTLFNELMQGNDDVVEILANEEWPVGNAPILNKEGLLKWWKKNCTRYELPQQFANFKGSSQLCKWKRIEGQDCKITVFDAQNGMSSLAVDSDGASRLTPMDLKNFFDSITRVDTNMYLKCANSGGRYRCIFNEILYGARSNKYGEVLMLPEGASLVMANVETKLVFLPIVSGCSSRRGFYVCLKKNDIKQGVRLKNGFLLFTSPTNGSSIGCVETAKGNAGGCVFKGVELKPSLAE